MKRADPSPTGWWLQFWRDMLAVRVPPEKHWCKPKPGSQSRTPEPGRGALITSGCEKQWDSYPTGRDRSPVETQASSERANRQNFVHIHSPRALIEGGWSRLKLHEGSLWLVALGRVLEVQLLGSLCGVILPYCRCRVPWVQHNPPLSISLR